MLKAIIVDDERGAQETLLSMLKMFCPNVQVLDVASSVSEAKALIETYSLDLVFLDIRMPFENGFSLLEALGTYDFHVIFTTAYNNYSLKAIKFSALDYLLKPINYIELKQAVDKVAQRPKNKKQYEILKIHQQNENDGRIVLPYKRGYRIAECKEILRLKGERNYSRVFFVNGEELLVAKTLKELEELLVDFGFFRTHQSHIINLQCVKDYQKGKSGKIKLINNSEVELARNRKQDFLKLLDAF